MGDCREEEKLVTIISIAWLISSRGLRPISSIGESLESLDTGGMDNKGIPPWEYCYVTEAPLEGDQAFLMSTVSWICRNYHVQNILLFH